MTTKSVEDLLVTKIKTITAFNRVESLTASEYRDKLSDAESAVALVAFDEDQSIGINPQLVVEETYLVAVITRKKGADSNMTPHSLCESVRSLIHGQQFGETDIMPFQYARRKLISYEGDTIVWEVSFRTKKLLYIPV